MDPTFTLTSCPLLYFITILIKANENRTKIKMNTSLIQIIQLNTFKTSFAIEKNRKSLIFFIKYKQKGYFSIIFRNNPSAQGRYLFS